MFSKRFINISQVTFRRVPEHRTFEVKNNETWAACDRTTRININRIYLILILMIIIIQ